MTAGKKAWSNNNHDDDPNPARTRNHKFESFTQRVARLKIDPIRRNRNEELERDDLQSHFQNGLRHWKESNLSESFSNFVQEIDPLCDSLPQVLHHKTKIVEVLHRYLKERNILSLEPLLNLTSCLADDLGHRFEEYFSTTLTLILDIAAKHKDIEAVEWSFSCLAWLFKYLSRLLVPDIRPTYDLVAKALGKENHKPFIARFAAEALSFLVRKAASISSKDPEPLNKIVNYIYTDLDNYHKTSKNYDIYRYGIMSLFSNTIKGVENGFHTVAPVVFQCLLQQITSRESEDILIGVLTSSIHHGDASTMAPVTQLFHDHIVALSPSSDEREFEMSLKVLYTLATVRHGTRVKDWQIIFQPITKLVQYLAHLNPSLRGRLLPGLARVNAVVFSNARQENCIANIRLLNDMSDNFTSEACVTFCVLLAELNQERFSQYCLAFFLRYLTMTEQAMGDFVLLAALRILDHSIRLDNAKQLTSSYQTYLAELFQHDSDEHESLSLRTGYLDLLPNVNLANSTRQKIGNSLAARVATSQVQTIGMKDIVQRYYMGSGMKFALQYASAMPMLEQFLQNLYHFSTMPVYIDNLRQFLSSTKSNVQQDSALELVNEIMKNLSSPSKELRCASLTLLENLHHHDGGKRSAILGTALDLENLTLEAKTVRTASMQVRRLGEQYHSIEENSWLIEAIPIYCFGLLHFKLGQVKIEAMDVLKQISSNSKAEAIVADLAFEWLDNTYRKHEPAFRPTDDPKVKYNEFDCSNRTKVSRLLAKSELDLENAAQSLQDRHSKAHASQPRINEYCRSLALEVLKHLPDLAEKRSRRLVPVFLKYLDTSPLETEEQEEQVEGEEEEAMDNTEAQEMIAMAQPERLARREQLAFLHIFGLFSNPRMLYQTSEVHLELLRFLSSGDAGIQKAALKALSTWKSATLDRYAENLGNLLDDTRFREELTTFLNRDEVLTDAEREELLPVLLRLLYGRIISKTGSASSKGSLSTKRRAVFDTLSRFSTTAIQEFTNIALGSLTDLEYVESKAVSPSGLQLRLPTQRQQLGLLNLMWDMVESLGNKIVPTLSSILPAILFCGQEASGKEDSIASATIKDIRRSALQCLASISNLSSTTHFVEFLPGLIDTFLTPRLNKLAVETSQSVSAVLQLLSCFAASAERCLWLVVYDNRILDAVTQILITPAVKDSVLLFIIDQIIRPIARISIAREDSNSLRVKEKVLQPNTSHILERIGRILENNPERRILAATLSLLSDLAGSVEESTHIHMLLHLSASLLSQPASRVSPRSKGDILGYLTRFIPLSGITDGSKLLVDLEASLIPLFMYFKDRTNRAQLTNVLIEIARLDVDLKESAELCSNLDAISLTSIDEPDFDRRLEAFDYIEVHAGSFTERHWQPLIYSLLYHVQDTEELVVRTSASASLKTFIKVAAASGESQSPKLLDLVDKIILPALRHGATNRSELVRVEYLSIFAETVKQFSAWERVNDLSALLVNDDEEASFFSNILHIQQHRRLRALRRLAAEASKGQLQSNNIAHFLIPLLEHFVLDQPDDKTEHNVIFETITTLSKLALGLEWPQFRAMFRRYTTYVLTNPDLEKAAIRLLTMMTDALSQVTESDVSQINAMEIDIEGSNTSAHSHRLKATLPKGDKLSEDVAKNLTAPLRQYVHQKDESLVSQRVPVAVTVSKLIMLLSEDQIVQQLPPLLTDVCQILRSRTQESRDLARKTLTEISKTVGPAYFGFILKELRTALPRGYQLHVLSFTTHMLLVNNEPLIENGELDYCLYDIANIIMDDMFGVTGQEKDAEDYISQMREVKSNKSYDSMEIVARISSLGRMNSLLQPIMALLEERLDFRMLKKIDELLRRLGVGLLRNQAIHSQAALILCFELLKQVYNKEPTISTRSYQDHRKKRFLINMNSVKKSNITHATTSAIHKLARFGFDLLRTILSRHETLQIPNNIVGFMPVIGEGIMSNHEEVQVSVVRLLATIIRVPLVELDRNAPVYVSEAMNLIKTATSTSSEASQAALKLVTVLLRDRDNVNVKEADISYILKRIRTDLDEPDRQGITFNFLKAVLHRKVVVAEVYEILDAVGAIMIRDQSVSARNAARGVYYQFLVNYPQGKDRLRKQWSFLIKNLDYEFETGRQSVLETIHLLLSRVGDKTVQDIINNFFAPLVLATINDESADCRKMSALLLKEFFGQADDDTLTTMLVLIRSWMNQDIQSLLFRVALQTFTLYIEAEPSKAERDLPLLMTQIEHVLERSDQENAADEWKAVYYSLQLLLKAVPVYPDVLLKEPAARLWRLTIESSHYPHAWVKSATSKLLGLYFADFARSQVEQETISLPIIGSGGLRLDISTMMNVTRSSLNSLKVVGINEEFATQLVKNTVFLGRLYDAVAGKADIVKGNVQFEDSEEDDATDNEKDEVTFTPVDPLAFIFARISFILRRETVNARAASMVPKTASIQLLAALCSTLLAQTLSANSMSILKPLHVITDPATTVPFSTDGGFKAAHTDLIASAQELMALLQSKMGTSVYIHALNQVREQMKRKRDDRKIKRRIEAVAEPEKIGYKRTKKRSQQREKRKEKNAGHRAQRRGW